MSDETKPKKPIIALVLGGLLCLKLFSGLGMLYSLSGIVFYVVVIQLIIITFVIFSMNTIGGGLRMIKIMIYLISVTMILDILLIFIMFNGREIPSLVYPQVVGAELSYLIAIAYLCFSKKLKRYKSFGAL